MKHLGKGAGRRDIIRCMRANVVENRSASPSPLSTSKHTSRSLPPQEHRDKSHDNMKNSNPITHVPTPQTTPSTLNPEKNMFNQPPNPALPRHLVPPPLPKKKGGGKRPQEVFFITSLGGKLEGSLARSTCNSLFCGTTDTWVHHGIPLPFRRRDGR